MSGQEPRWTFNFELPLLTLMSRFSTVLLLIIFTEIMPKESVTSLKQQNQDLKDKVDALSKEITQLKENVRSIRPLPLVLKQLLRLVIAIIMLRIMKPCLVVYNISATNTTTCRRPILVSLINSRH